jgi:RHS repeat-associated protein
VKTHKTKMKTKLTFALVALMTSTAFAEFKAPLPEFKNEKQLAEWRAEKASEATSRGGVSDDTAFYTGKPYVSLTDSYAFKYRLYSPQVARWTTEDPSGFPDGANKNIYAPTPTNDLDVAGLLKWSTLINKNTIKTIGSLSFCEWTVETNDGSSVINLWMYLTGASYSSDYTYNCHGFTFGNSTFWIDGQVDEILRGDGYKEITGPDKTGAKVAYWGDNVHTAKVTEVVNGVVTEVVGKRGATVGLKTSTPAGQEYDGTIKYYE